MIGNEGPRSPEEFETEFEESRQEAQSLPEPEVPSGNAERAESNEQQVAWTIDNLASLCPAVETAEMAALSAEQLESYIDLGGSVIEKAATAEDYQMGNIGLYLGVARLKFHAGDVQGALVELEEAMDHALNIGRDDIAEAIKSVGRAIEDSLYGPEAAPES